MNVQKASRKEIKLQTRSFLDRRIKKECNRRLFSLQKILIAVKYVIRLFIRNVFSSLILHTDTLTGRSAFIAVFQL